MNVANALKIAKLRVSQESPAILVGVGSSGVIASILLGIMATPEAQNIIFDLRDEYRERFNREPTRTEIAKAIWKVYIPTVISTGISLGCIVLSHTISSKRAAAVASLLSITEAAFSEYKEKVVTIAGKGKANKIQEEIDQDHIDKKEPPAMVVVSDGTILCFDTLSSRYFRSSAELIRRAMNEFNAELLREVYLPLNQWYDYVGLEDIEMGHDVGWFVDTGLVDLKFTTKLARNSEPCLVINYTKNPIPLSRFS